MFRETYIDHSQNYKGTVLDPREKELYANNIRALFSSNSILGYSSVRDYFGAELSFAIKHRNFLKPSILLEVAKERALEKDADLLYFNMFSNVLQRNELILIGTGGQELLSQFNCVRAELARTSKNSAIPVSPVVIDDLTY